MAVRALVVVSLLVACGKAPQWRIIGDYGDRARDRGELPYAIETYREAVWDADTADDGDGAERMIERVHATERARAHKALAAAHEAADPDLAIELLRPVVVVLATGYDNTAFARTARHATTNDFYKATKRYMELAPFTADDRAAIQRALEPELAARYTTLLTRLAADGDRPTAGHALFLIAPILARADLAAARERAGLAIAARAEEERAGMPGLAAWHAHVARQLGTAVEPVELPPSASTQQAWTIRETGDCNLTTPSTGTDGIPVLAQVALACRATQHTADVDTTVDEVVTERIAEKKVIGTHWATETETVYDTEVGQKSYDCSTGNEKKFCVQSFEKQVPRTVNHMKQVDDTETVIVPRQHTVSHKVHGKHTTYQLIVRGTVRLSWSGGAFDVPVKADASGETAAAARAAAAVSVSAAIGSASGQLAGKLQAQRSAELAALARSTPERALDLALQDGFHANDLADPALAWLARTERVAPAVVLAVFKAASAPGASTAVVTMTTPAPTATPSPSATPAPSSSPTGLPPGITQEELAFANILEQRSNRHEKLSDADIHRYGEISAKVTAAKQALAAGRVTRAELDFAVEIERKYVAGETVTEAEEERYKPIAARIKGE